MKEEKKSLKELYGFNKGSYKYITPGSEILKYIGQNVVLVEFKKDEQGNWTNSYGRCFIKSINDYDPMTMTYKCTYVKENSTEEKYIRIIPEGFSFEDSDKTGTMTRFIPMSMHFTLMEDEFFYMRLKELYVARKTMSIDYLKNIAESKEMNTMLRYSQNIGVAIKTQDNDILWVRLTNLKVIHKNGNKYFVSFGDDKNVWSTILDSTENKESYQIKDMEMKIIDLSD